MIIDGKQIADEVFTKTRTLLGELSFVPKLTVITSKPNFETQKFLAVKKKKADELGITVNIIELDPSLTTDECVATIKKAAEHSDGIVVQFPFPAHIDRNALIQAIPGTHDVDAFHLVDDEVLPPVVGAIQEIVKRHTVEINGKRCVVIGEGRLVGVPAADWFEKKGADVLRLNKENENISECIGPADIVVLGAGVPGLLKPEMIKEGVVIFDAGTSEAEGKLKGDADPACAEKAGIFTPVPGGIGPITVAALLRNLVLLAKKDK